MNIYNKLYYDICRVLYPGIQRISFNRDGGIVRTYTKDYTASFGFSYQLESNITKQLSIISFNNMIGRNLFDFIDKITDANLIIPIDDKGLLERDISKCLFDVVKIVINDSIVDNTFVEVLKKYFPQLREVEFQHCKINSDCSFEHMNNLLSFEDCEIENIRSFHECEAELSFLRVKINKISPTMISSEKIKIKSIMRSSDINIYELFLKCDFKKLKQLEVDFHLIDDFFERGFFYLPFSAPNLEEIFIGGKVKDLKFLTKCKYLREIQIHAIEDELGLGIAVVTDHKERRKILERNNRAYQIRKILDPKAEDKYLVGELEMERIQRLCHFLSFLANGTEEWLLDNPERRVAYLLSKKIDMDVKTYYEYDDGILYLKKSPTNLEAFFDRKPQYRIVRNFLYENPLNRENKIVLAKDFIYRQDGIPIIFKHGGKKIKTKEEAIRFMEKRTIRDDDSSIYNNNRFLEYLMEYTEEDMPITCFIDMVQEEFQLDITEETFKGLEGSDEISKAIFQYSRVKQSKEDIKEKQELYRESLIGVIERYYPLFDFQDKVYLYIHQEDNVINSNNAIIEKRRKDYSHLIGDEEEILESINQKTNGFYSKYQQYMKLTYKSYNTRTQDIEVKKSYIKKIKI